MTHACLRGYGSLHEFTRLGARIIIFGKGDIMIINYNDNAEFAYVRHQEPIQKIVCQRAPRLQNMCFLLKIHLALQKGTFTVGMFSFTNIETVT